MLARCASSNPCGVTVNVDMKGSCLSDFYLVFARNSAQCSYTQLDLSYSSTFSSSYLFLVYLSSSPHT